MILYLTKTKQKNDLQKKELAEKNSNQEIKIELVTLRLSCFKYFYLICMLINYVLSLTKCRNHNIDELMTHENNLHVAFNVHIM